MLIAAHCLAGLLATEWEILVGDHNLVLETETSTTTTYKIKSFLIHSGYNEQTFENDIGLIEVVKSFRFNYGVKPVCLPFRYLRESMIGTKVIVTGWGSTEFGM